MAYLFFPNKKCKHSEMMAKFIHRYIIKLLLKGKDINRADGCSYHKLKVMKNILVEVSRAVTQNENLYS